MTAGSARCSAGLAKGAISTAVLVYAHTSTFGIFAQLHLRWPTRVKQFLTIFSVENLLALDAGALRPPAAQTPRQHASCRSHLLCRARASTAGP